MLALCTYPLGSSSAVDLLDVARAASVTWALSATADGNSFDAELVSGGAKRRDQETERLALHHGQSFPGTSD